MALLGFIKTREDVDGEPVLRDRPTILAYLEELIRLDRHVQVWFGKDDLLPASARIRQFNEDRNTMVLGLNRSIPGTIQASVMMEAYFVIDGIRFCSVIKFLERDAYLTATFQIPDVVKHAERREKVRTHFSKRERATVMMMEGLFDGIGASGHLENLSMTGLCVTLERAISIRDDRKLPIKADLFQVGMALPVIRIQNLPRTPMVECAARVAHISHTPDGVRLGLKLEHLDSDASETLRQVLSRRLPTFGRGFPVKRRWADRMVDTDPRDQDGQEDLDPPSTLPDEALVEAQDGDGPSTASDRLVAIKKRGKRILIVGNKVQERSDLSSKLNADGYPHVFDAGNIMDVLKVCRTNAISLILLEQSVGGTEAPDFVRKLRKMGIWEEETPIVMLSPSPGVKTTLLAKSVGIAHVQLLPVDYDADFQSKLIQLMF